MNEFSFVTDSLALFILYSVLGASIFLISILGTHAKFLWRFPLMVVLFATYMGVSYFSLGQLLGQPKPVDILTWDRPDVEEARVLAQYFKRGEGIYLLLSYPGQEIPRYYEFPWNEEMMKALQKAKEAEVAEDIQGILLKYPFQPSLEDREFPEVHELPWPAPEPKDHQDIEQIDLNSIDV